MNGLLTDSKRLVPALKWFSFLFKRKAKSVKRSHKIQKRIEQNVKRLIKIFKRLALNVKRLVDLSCSKDVLSKFYIIIRRITIHLFINSRRLIFFMRRLRFHSLFAGSFSLSAHYSLRPSTLNGVYQI